MARITLLIPESIESVDADITLPPSSQPRHLNNVKQITEKETKLPKDREEIHKKPETQMSTIRNQSHN